MLKGSELCVDIPSSKSAGIQSTANESAAMAADFGQRPNDAERSDCNTVATDRNRQRRTFVYAVCGDAHVRNVNVSLSFLKRFSSSEIVVVKGRTSVSVKHDQVIDVELPARYNDHEASIILKTSLHRILAGTSGRICYLDSDTVAVDDRIDEIFDQWLAPVAFAADHTQIDRFSPSAVNCGCAPSSRCEHLRKAIDAKFHVAITYGDWQHWNGGVFLFGPESEAFLNAWHASTLAILHDRFWKTRDQGTLAATVWQFGLQNQTPLRNEFNYIIDPFRNRRDAERASLQPRQYTVDERYSLEPVSHMPHPRLLHLINGGMGKRGWKNWDDAEALLHRHSVDNRSTPAVTRVVPSIQGTDDTPHASQLTPDNRLVHGMWVGESLSKLELLTLHSFLENGHEFHLWAYDNIKTRLPAGVRLEDATKILPREAIYRRKEIDPETGVGKNSLGPFSDLFRCKLLYEMGGYWADMDVTCLRPLDFDTEYVFRSHRVGTVGNLMKCPKQSQVMLDTYTTVRDSIDENSEWLAPVRMLAGNVDRLNLSCFIRHDICNEDRWIDGVQCFVEENTAIPSQWYVIHWINEFWRTVEAQQGRYRGRKVLDYVPDKNRPLAGSTLAQLYRKYDLLEECKVVLPVSAATTTLMVEGAITTCPDRPIKQAAPINRSATEQPSGLQFDLKRHINILMPSLARGGAEKSVLDTLSGLRESASTGNLFVLYETDQEFPVKLPDRYRILKLSELDERKKLKRVALEVQASPSAVLYTHMIPVRQLEHLWNLGIQTAPVIQNSQPAWQDPAGAFTGPWVPFVVAVSDAVASQLRQNGCTKPVVTIRHELQNWYAPEDLEEQRAAIRRQYGIRDDTLLLGMVGQFKSQKAYPRAVRVLHEVQKLCRAKLMILGGWDHEYGNGRITYTATCRQALELGVMPDVLMPGDVFPVQPYYAAFDIFLNTSIYEGLSVATLEAIQNGCPVVTADAGGNREVLPPSAVLVEDPSDVAAYVAGIANLAARVERVVPQRPPDAELAPRLWCMLARYGTLGEPEQATRRRGTLFLTDNLNTGGPQRSLTNLLCHMPWDFNAHLCICDTVYAEEYFRAVKPHAAVYSLSAVQGLVDRAEHILRLAERSNVRNICFWNLDARLKLLLAKALEVSAIRLIDVSPGPMLFDEMRDALRFQRRVSFSSHQYFRRLDAFVSKYQGGGPPETLADSVNVMTIPNGVALPGGSIPDPPDDFRLPGGANPNLVIGTVCRIAPTKRIEFLVDMMETLTPGVPGVSLIVVGGVDPRHVPYWETIQERVARSGLTNIRFVGGHGTVAPFLKMFKLFVMISEQQGCPNASLEAMAMGLPVVANASGGTGEQVEHGVNGFLVSDQDPADMAKRVEFLLRRPWIREVFGKASRQKAGANFSMQQMVARYLRLFQDGDTTD